MWLLHVGCVGGRAWSLSFFGYSKTQRAIVPFTHQPGQIVVHKYPTMCSRPAHMSLSCHQACLPVAAHLPSFKVDQHLQEGEAAAWQLQVHAAALQIVLTEVHLNAQPAETVRVTHILGLGGCRVTYGLSDSGLRMIPVCSMWMDWGSVRCLGGPLDCVQDMACHTAPW